MGCVTGNSQMGDESLRQSAQLAQNVGTQSNVAVYRISSLHKPKTVFHPAHLLPVALQRCHQCGVNGELRTSAEREAVHDNLEHLHLPARTVSRKL